MSSFKVTANGTSTRVQEHAKARKKKVKQTVSCHKHVVGMIRRVAQISAVFSAFFFFFLQEKQGVGKMFPFLPLYRS